MSFQADLSLITCNQTQQNLFEAGMCYEVCEYIYVIFAHKWETFHEEIQILDEQIV